MHRYSPSSHTARYVWRSIGRVLAVGVFVLFGISFTSSVYASVQETTVDLPGSVPPNLASLTPVTPPILAQPEQITIALIPRDYARLQQIGGAVTDPTSPTYRHFLTNADIARDFAPTSTAFARVETYFRAKGLRIVYRAEDRTLLTVEGTRDQLDTAFGTHSTYGRNRFGDGGFVNTTALRLPASLVPLLVGVLGMDGTQHAHLTVQTHEHGAGVTNVPSGVNTVPLKPAQPQGSGPFTSFGVHDPTALRTAYNVPNYTGGGALNGAGRTVGVIMWNAPRISDLTAWNTTYPTFPAIPTSAASTPALTIINNAATGSATLETDLDITNIHTAAPSANITVYSATSSTFANILPMITQAVSDNVTAINNSYGGCDLGVDAATYASFHTQFTTAQAKGIVITAASGDEGIYGCVTNSGTLANVGSPGYAEYPATDTLVTAVGGTFVNVNTSTFAWQGEVPWNCGSVVGGLNDQACDRADGGGAGGGGLSLHVAQPSYQVGRIPDPGSLFDPAARAAYTTGRATPDISTNGDPNSGLIFYDNGIALNGGGTSAAAPWLAGISALLAQARSSSFVGYLNTNLYRACPNTTWCYDVISGYTGVSSAPNWDYTTGLGTIKDVTAFINDFANSTFLPDVSQSFGGAFTAGGSTLLTISVSNANASILNGIGFTDTLQPNLTVNGAATNSCGGIFTAANGSSTMSLSAVTLTGSATCTVSVPVTATIAAIYTANLSNITGMGGTTATSGAFATVTITPGPLAGLGLVGATTVSPTLGTQVTVTALDTHGNAIPSYTGTVSFSSSDTQAVLPSSYTFTAADKGVHAFVVIFATPGSTSLTVGDGTYTAVITPTETAIVGNLSSTMNNTLTPNGAITYTLTFLNPASAGSVSNITWNVTLPANITPASAISGTLASLAANTTASVTINATVNSGVTDGTILTTTATFTYAGSPCGAGCPTNPTTHSVRNLATGPTPSAIYTSEFSNINGGVMKAPTGVSSSDDRVYVADNGNTVVIGYSNAQNARAWGANIGVSVTDVAGESSVTTYVAAPTNNSVYRLTAIPSINRTYSTGLNAPYGVAVDKTGNTITGIFIANTGANTVLHYTGSSTTSDRTYSGLNGPRGVTSDRNGGLYVADTGNNRVLHYTGSSTTSDASYTVTDPYGVAVDPANGLWVSSSAQNRVLHFLPGTSTADQVVGQPTLIATASGAGAGNVNAPKHISLDSYGQMFVADATNNRITRYMVPYATLTETPSGAVAQGATISFTLTLTNPNAGTLNGATAAVPLPAGLTFIQGSLQVTLNGVTQPGYALADITAGVSLPSISTQRVRVGNSAVALTFQAVVNGNDAANSTYTTAAIFNYPNSSCPIGCTTASATTTITNTAPLAARIAYVNVAADGTVTWAAAREERNLGYDLYAVLADGTRTRLNSHIIAAHSILGQPDSLYTAHVSLPAGATGVILTDIEPGGTTRQHGPYPLGQSTGSVPAYAPAVQAAPTSDPAKAAPGSIKLARTDAVLSIAQDGIYHLDTAALAAQGIDMRGVAPDKLALSLNGSDVPLYVHNAGPHAYGAGDYIEFAAQAADSFYSGSAAYILTARPSRTPHHLTQPPSLSLQPKPGDPAAQTASQTLPGQRFFWSEAPSVSEAWNWALLENDIPQLADQSLPFAIPGLYNAGSFANQLVTVTLNLRGWGGYDDVNPDHHVVADLGGVHAEATFDNNDKATLTLNVPASALVATGNSLRLRMPGDMGAAYDTVLLESINVSYPKATALPASLTSVAGVRSFTRPAELRNAISKQANGKRVDYVIIAYPAFVSGVAPLAQQHRTQDKMHVATVDVNAVYDSYSNGNADPAAIQRFIAALKAQNGLKYALLVGADSWDPRNFLGTGGGGCIPSVRVPDSYGTLAPTDAPFADTTGDGLPDVAVGRLPVRTTDELSALVAKTVSFNATATTAPKATFVNDPTDPTFAAMAQADVGGLPQKAQVTNITWTTKATRSAATAALVAQWQAGSRLITYTGHSNADLWADDVVLDASALDSLKGSTAALVAVWGCWAATYDRPGVTGLSQALLSLPNGGAAAVIASTTEVSADEHAPTAAAFYSALYANGKSQRVGDALLHAKRAMLTLHTDWSDMANGVLLLGDPAARA